MIRIAVKYVDAELINMAKEGTYPLLMVENESADLKNQYII